MVDINSSALFPAAIPAIDAEPALADDALVESGAEGSGALEADEAETRAEIPAAPLSTLALRPSAAKPASITAARVDALAVQRPETIAASAGIVIGGMRFANLDAPIAIGAVLGAIVPLRLMDTHRLPWLIAAAVTALTFAYSSSAAGPMLPLFATIACTFAMGCSFSIISNYWSGERDSTWMRTALAETSLRGAAYWFRQLKESSEEIARKPDHAFEWSLLSNAENVPAKKGGATYNYASLLGPRSAAKIAKHLTLSPRGIVALREIAKKNAYAANAKAVADLEIRWKPEAMDDSNLTEAVKWLFERGNTSVVRYLRVQAGRGSETASKILETLFNPKLDESPYRTKPRLRVKL